MNNIIGFKKKPSSEPTHIQGEARCARCNHCFEAKTPVGCVKMECPKCHAMEVTFIYPIDPPIAEVWECGCGSDLFYIGRKAMYCSRCGLEQVFED